MKVFIKYWQNNILKSETVSVKRAYINIEGSWVIFKGGTKQKVGMVILISPKWYNETALKWFEQFGE